MRAVEEKAIRLVMEGRVVVRWKADDYLAGSGTVDGDTDTYQVSFDPSGRLCSCPSVYPCSHSLALELEVTRQREEVTI